jgi:hypothetical protein
MRGIEKTLPARLRRESKAISKAVGLARPPANRCPLGLSAGGHRTPNHKLRATMDLKVPGGLPYIHPPP